MLCQWIRDDLTAHADGELRGWRALWVRRHLAGCAACAGEATILERSIAEQLRVLRALGPPPIAADDLWRQVRRRMSDSEPADALSLERRWIPMKRWVLATAAACVVAGIFLARPLDPWLIAVGLENPPKAVIEKPELFVDYPLFEHLEAIEHLDNPEREDGGSQRG